MPQQTTLKIGICAHLWLIVITHLSFHQTCSVCTHNSNISGDKTRLPILTTLLMCTNMWPIISNSELSIRHSSTCPCAANMYKGISKSIIVAMENRLEHLVCGTVCSHDLKIFGAGSDECEIYKYVPGRSNRFSFHNYIHCLLLRIADSSCVPRHSLAHPHTEHV